MDFFGLSCCIRALVVVFGQGGCIWAKLWYSDKSCSNRSKVVVFGKVVVFEQKWFCSGKSS